MPKGVKGFQKGQASNPQGMLPIGDDLKNARKLVRSELERLLNKYFFEDFFNIQEVLNKVARGERVNVPTGELLIMSVCYTAIKEGDEKKLSFLLDRMIGQVVRKIKVMTEVEDHDANSKGAPVEMTPEEKMQMIEVYKKKLQEKLISNAKHAEPIVVNDLNKNEPKKRKARKKNGNENTPPGQD